jgi:hypothetical protein
LRGENSKIQGSEISPICERTAHDRRAENHEIQAAGRISGVEKQVMFSDWNNFYSSAHDLPSETTDAGLSLRHPYDTAVFKRV